MLQAKIRIVCAINDTDKLVRKELKKILDRIQILTNE